MSKASRAPPLDQSQRLYRGAGVLVGVLFLSGVCSLGCSSYQGCGVCIVRMVEPTLRPGDTGEVTSTQGTLCQAELCTFPMDDKERLIPCGKRVDIPTFSSLRRQSLSPARGDLGVGRGARGHACHHDAPGAQRGDNAKHARLAFVVMKVFFLER